MVTPGFINFDFPSNIQRGASVVKHDFAIWISGACKDTDTPIAISEDCKDTDIQIAISGARKVNRHPVFMSYRPAF